MTNDKKNVAVVGAGIVGVSTAVWLQRNGHEVTLIDREGPAAGASYGNGGVLASCSVVPVTVPGLIRKAPRMLFDPNQPLFLKWNYLPRLLPWLVSYLRHGSAEKVNHRAEAMLDIVGDSLADHQALANGTDASKWIVPSDYLYLYKDRAHYESDSFGWNLRRKFGFEWDLFEEREFRNYDPVFGPQLNFAVRMKNHGRISDPGQYVRDLASHVVSQGGRMVKGEATDVVREDGRVAGIRTGGETIPCDAAVVATGAWSGSLSKKMGISPPLETERGYHVELWEPNVMPRSPVMIASGKFVATPMEGRLRLAGIVEYGGLSAPPSRAPVKLLLNSIRSVIPGLKWKEKTEWMGHRPAITDSLPVIGEVPGIQNAFLGFGHDHVGLTGGPKTGRLLAQLISNQKVNINLSPFTPERFNRR